jgi:hypothetical protein
MNNATEFTFPLIGFRYGTRTNIAARILNNKDAALLILAANGGVMRVSDVKALLRGWRPGTTGRNVLKPSRWNHRLRKRTPAVFGTDPAELHFSYLFNTYYGHITEDYNRTEGDRGGWCSGRKGANRYSSGPFMWRPFKNRAAISALGRARLRTLAAQATAAGMVLEPEVLASAAQPE